MAIQARSSVFPPIPRLQVFPDRVHSFERVPAPPKLIIFGTYLRQHPFHRPCCFSFFWCRSLRSQFWVSCRRHTQTGLLIRLAMPGRHKPVVHFCCPVFLCFLGITCWECVESDSVILALIWPRCLCSALFVPPENLFIIPDAFYDFSLWDLGMPAEIVPPLQGVFRSE